MTESIWNERYPNDPKAGVTPAARATREILDIQGALRNLPTLKGVFAPGAIDPRAIDYGEPVDVARLARGSYSGEVAWARHEGGLWSLMWDRALNSGVGAWAVVGGAPLVDEQGSTGNHSGAEGPMPNTPALTVPASGVYRVSAFGRATIAGSAATSDATVRLGVNSVGSSVLGIETAGTQFHGSTVGGSTGDLTLAKNDALTLRVAGSGSVVWAFGLTLPWRMFLHPIELRP